MRKAFLLALILGVVCAASAYATDPACVFSQTEDSYSILVTAATFGGNPLTSNDYICVWDGALSVGGDSWTDTPPLGLAAWADDSQTGPTDGYICGHPITFTIYTGATGMTYPATATWNTGYGTFCDGVVSIVTLDGICPMPNTPGWATATPLPGSINPSARLEWEDLAGAGDVITHYDIERMCPTEGDYTLYATVAGNVVTFDDLGLCCGLGTYDYRITPVNDCGSGTPVECSTNLTGNTLCRFADRLYATRADGTVKLQWSLEGWEDAIGFVIYKKDMDGLYNPIHPGMITESYFMDDLANDDQASYKVVMIRADGSQSRPRRITVPKATDTSLPAVLEESTSWSAVKQIFR